MTDRFTEVTEYEQPNGYCQRVFKTTRTDCPSAEVVGHEYRFNTDFYQDERKTPSLRRGYKRLLRSFLLLNISFNSLLINFIHGSFEDIYLN